MTPPPVVLLAEDDAMVGLDLKDALQEAGYRVLGPLATADEAFRVLGQETPTLAIIDIVLQDGPCSALVHELRRSGIPFLVHSGRQRSEPLADDLQDVPWLAKPAYPWDVVALCDELSLTASASTSKMPGAAPGSPVRLVDQSAAVSRNPLVRKLEGFVFLSDDDRAVLEQISAEVHVVGPRTDLVREGDRPDGVVLIMGGIACRHKYRLNGQRQILAYLVPGDLCDLDVALLSEMDHTITTLSACRVVRLTPETVARLLERHPAVARALRMTTLVDEATLREWLVNVGRRSALERVAHLLCELLVRLQVVGQASANAYELPLTQTDLADTVGLSSVHVNRTLQELRRQRVIEMKGKRLTILSLPQLRALAEFKPNYLHLGDRLAA